MASIMRARLSGGYSNPGAIGSPAFSLSGTTYTSLTYPGAIETHAQGINNAGTIVGYYDDASGDPHGFSLSNGVYTALNVPGASNTVAQGINNTGTIVGYDLTASGIQGFEAIPVPTPIPGAILLFAPGLAGLAAVRRRFGK